MKMKVDCYLVIRDMLSSPTVYADKILYNLLLATEKFLVSTDSDDKNVRNKGITLHRIEEILQKAADGLESFKATGRTDRNYELCKNAIIEQLQKLDKDDKISEYYNTEGNASKLKSLLSAGDSDDDHTTSSGHSPK